MGINRFSDMTEEEFLKVYNNPILNEHSPQLQSDEESRQLFLTEKKL
jgi:hypothetical protein